MSLSIHLHKNEGYSGNIEDVFKSTVTDALKKYLSPKEIPYCQDYIQYNADSRYLKQSVLDDPNKLQNLVDHTINYAKTLKGGVTIRSCVNTYYKQTLLSIVSAIQKASHRKATLPKVFQFINTGSNLDYNLQMTKDNAVTVNVPYRYTDGTEPTPRTKFSITAIFKFGSITINAGVVLESTWYAERPRSRDEWETAIASADNGNPGDDLLIGDFVPSSYLVHYKNPAGKRVYLKIPLSQESLDMVATDIVLATADPSKTSVAPAIYVYACRSTGTDVAYLVFIQATSPKTALDKARSYIEAHREDLFSTYASKELVYPVSVLHNATLIDPSVLVFKNRYGDVTNVDALHGGYAPVDYSLYGACSTESFPNGVDSIDALKMSDDTCLQTFKGHLYTRAERDALNSNFAKSQDDFRIVSASVREFSWKTYTISFHATDNQGTPATGTVWFNGLHNSFENPEQSGFSIKGQPYQALQFSSNLCKDIRSHINNGDIRIEDGWHYQK